jgi:16S rRNA (uracil1498-N3)-methyltransferase
MGHRGHSRGVMKHRVHVPTERISDQTASLVRAEAGYLGLVLRLAPGDRVEVFDGEGRVYEARIERLGPEDGTLVLTAPKPRPAPRPFVLLQGLPKGDKMDLVVQKATELGVTEIRPVACSRSVVRYEGERAAKKAERWRRIGAEAARQCGRADLPVIHAPTSLQDALVALRDDELVKMIARVGATSVGLRTFLSSVTSAEPGHALAVGPEGGFTPSEVDAAVGAGFTPVSLGDRILRTETVALAVLAAVRFHIGDLG